MWLRDLFALASHWILPLSTCVIVLLNASVFVHILLRVQQHRLNRHSIDKLRLQIVLDNDHDNNDDDNRQKENESGKEELRVGFVVAHPDDEAMFMVPTLRGLVDGGRTGNLRIRIFMLCLSTGNAVGLGQERVEEWRQCLLHVGILEHGDRMQVVSGRDGNDVILDQWDPDARAILVDNESDFADGMMQQWDVDRIAEYVHCFATHFNIHALFTFDSQGISRHPNHCAVHHGVKQFISKQETRNRPSSDRSPMVVGYVLETCSIWRSYVGYLDALLPGAKMRHISDRHLSFIVQQGHMMDAYRAMRRHVTQFVWFRKLFVIFSRYAYYNTWTTIGPTNCSTRDSSGIDKKMKDD